MDGVTEQDAAIRVGKVKWRCFLDLFAVRLANPKTSPLQWKLIVHQGESPCPNSANVSGTYSAQ